MTSKQSTFTYKPIDLLGWKINNVKNFLFQEHPILHPDTPEFGEYWLNTQLKRSIEGLWINDDGQWIWMMPKLYWYINIGLIIDLDEKNKTRIPIRPKLRDIEWIIFTYLYACMGFSGFMGDDKYTCNEKYAIWLKDKKEGRVSSRLLEVQLKKLPLSIYNKAGELKEYMNPWDYLRIPKTKPLGLALYENETYDFFLLGSRGLGKSYTMSVGDLLHEFITKGIKYWEDIKNINKNKIEIFVGAAQKDKAQEFLDKARYCMDALPGSYGKGEDRLPSPFFNNLSGSWNIGNKELEHRYRSANGDWEGTKSKIIHGVFTVENPEAGVGIRPVRIYNEEVGLCSNTEDVYLANKNSLAIGGKKFGVGVYLGTSGNVGKIQQSRQLMTKPDTYRIYSMPNYWQGVGRLGLFIPAYYAINDFKDDNGNTDVESCIEYLLEKRKSMAPSLLQGEKMYWPLLPSEMFLTKKGNVLPVAELEMHRNKLLSYPDLHLKYTVGDLVFNTNETRGVQFIPDTKGRTPIQSFPSNAKDDTEGCLTIYEFPIEDEEGNVPKGMYIIGHDPVKTDEDGLSLTSVYVMKTPKYFTKYGGNELVASFIGRPEGGRNITNELIEKLAMFYGNHNRMVYFENAVGNVKEFFEKKKKLNLLAVQPTTVLSKKRSGGVRSTSVVYGYPMSNRVIKTEAITYLRDWLLEERGTNNGIPVRNLDYIYDLRLVEEMISFNYEDNFDAVMGVAGCIIGIEETYNQHTKKVNEEDKSDDILDFLNKGILKQNRLEWK